MKSIATLITYRCNFKCKFCLRNKSKKKDISLNLFSETIKEIKNMGYKLIRITGGEPCLHPQFYKIINIINKEKLKFCFVSNGSLLNKYKFLAYKYNKTLLNCSFSVDGSNKYIHDNLRGLGSFNKVIKSIKFFNSKKIPVKIQTTINKINQEDIYNIIEKVCSLGVQEINILNTIKTNKNKKLCLNNKEKERIKNKIKSIKNKNIKIFYRIPTFEFTEICPNLKTLKNLTINPDNKVMFCCNLLENKGIIGSLKADSFNNLNFKAHNISKKMINDNKYLNKKFNSHCEFCNHFL